MSNGNATNDAYYTCVNSSSGWLRLPQQQQRKVKYSTAKERPARNVLELNKEHAQVTTRV